MLGLEQLKPILPILKKLALLLNDLSKLLDEDYEKIVQPFQQLDSRYIATTIDHYLNSAGGTGEQAIHIKSIALFSLAKTLNPNIYFNRDDSILSAPVEVGKNLDACRALDRPPNIGQIFENSDKKLLQMLNAYFDPTVSDTKRHLLENSISELLKKLSPSEQEIKSNPEAYLFHFFESLYPLLYPKTRSALSLLILHYHACYKSTAALKMIALKFSDSEEYTSIQAEREFIEEQLSQPWKIITKFKTLYPSISNDIETRIAELTNSNEVILTTRDINPLKNPGLNPYPPFEVEKFNSWSLLTSCDWSDANIQANANLTTVTQILLNVTTSNNQLLSIYEQLERIIKHEYLPMHTKLDLQSSIPTATTTPRSASATPITPRSKKIRHNSDPGSPRPESPRNTWFSSAATAKQSAKRTGFALPLDKLTNQSSATPRTPEIKPK